MVHLIRDLNDDLWKAPFDREFEAFVVEIRALLVPILDAIDKHGSKAWHLQRFEKSVERFYLRNIVGKEYASEWAAKYRKRFQRYRESLFTFLGQDGVPWNNNMAERAIRQAVGHTEENLGNVLQEGGSSVPALVSDRSDLPLPGEVVPEVPVVERTGCRSVSAVEVDQVFSASRPTREPKVAAA